MEDFHTSRTKETPNTRLTASSLFQPTTPNVGGYMSSNSPGGSERFTKESLMTTSVMHSNPNKSLREDYFEERSKLEKQNFDLKMRIYYLEEHMKKMQDDEQRHTMTDDSLKNEMMDLKLQLEEKTIELEQRNLYMVKAKTAIDALKVEVERLKNEADRQNDLEDRVRKLKQINDDIEMDYKQQLMVLQNEIQNLNQRLSLKDREKDIVDDRVKQIEVSFAQTQDRFNAMNSEKIRIEDKWLNSQQYIAKLEDDVTQCRAHLELYQIRIDEEKEEIDKLKDELKEHHAAKLVAEEKHRNKLAEVTSKYELQLVTMRNNHEQELDKMRANHAKAIEEVRKNYYEELHKSKSHMEKNIQDMKQADAVDIQRVKDECAARIAEKNEEIKTLRRTIEGDHSLYESLVKDLEDVKAELREKNALLEHIKHDNQMKAEEIQAMHNLRLELQNKEIKVLDLQEAVKKEASEKLQISLRNDQLTAQIDSMKQTMKEQEAELHVSKMEMHRLTHVTSELGSKTDNMENVVRSNEKLTILHHKLQTELLEANHRFSNLERDFQLERNEKEKLLQEVRELNQELSAATRNLEEKTASLQEKSTLYTVEHGQRVTHEHSLTEQRKLVDSLRDDLQRLKDEATEQRQTYKDVILDYEEKCRCLLAVVSMSCDAMAQWDDTFARILQGGVGTGSMTATQERDFASNGYNGFSNGANGESPSTGRYPRSSLSYSQPQQPQHLSATSSVAAKYFTLPIARNQSGSSQHHLRGGYPSFQGSGYNHSNNYRFSGIAAGGGGPGFSPMKDGLHRFDEESGPMASLMMFAQHHQLLSSSELEQGRHEVSLIIERIHYKVERTMKIRQIFDQSLEKLTKNVEKNLETSQEKVKVLQHRLQDSQHELHRVQQVVTRDQELHHKELMELRQLREVLMEEHRRTIADHEAKYAQLLTQLEQEKASHSQSRQHVQQLQAENETRKLEINQLKSDLQAFEETEEIVAMIEQRMQSITAKNQSLESESLRLKISLEQATKERDLLIQEKNQAVQEIDRLSMQLDLKHAMIQDFEGKVERYQKEIDRLRSRQIDPELAMTLLSTQQQLSHQSSRQPGIEVNYSGNHRQSYNTDSASNGSNGKLVEILYATENSMKSLIERTEEGISRFTIISRNYSSSRFANEQNLQTRGKQLIQELQDDIEKLLQENANLLSKVIQWISGLKGTHSYTASTLPSSSYSANIRKSSVAKPRNEVPVYDFPNRKGLAGNDGEGIVLEDLMTDVFSPMKANSQQSTKESRPSTSKSKSNRPSSGKELPTAAIMSSMDTSELLELLDTKRTASKSKANTSIPSSSITSSGSRASKLDRSLTQIYKKLDAFDLSSK